VYSKRYLLDLYFYLGVVIFTLGKIFHQIFLDFYIYSNVIGLILLVYYLCLTNKLGKFSRASLILFSFILYLVGNLVFIQDISFQYIKLSDLFFFLQILIKQNSLIENFKLPITYNASNKFHIFLMLNISIIILCLSLSKLVDNNLIDLFYFVESFVSLLGIFYLRYFEFKLISKFNLEFFFIGQLFWVIGDLIYSDFRLYNFYILGDYSDLVFFIGFYFFLKSLTTNLRFLNVVKNHISSKIVLWKNIKFL